MRFISVDSIEEDIAICEDDEGAKIELNIDVLPLGVKETDVLKISDTGHIYIDREETLRRKAEIINLKNLLEKDK